MFPGIPLPHPAFQVTWASHHQWAPHEQMTDSYARSTALWLVDAGVIELDMPMRHLRLVAGDAVLIAGDVSRRIVTPQGASWHSLGINGIETVPGFELVSLLPLPLAWHPSDQNADLLMRTIQLLIEFDEEGGKTVDMVRVGYAHAALGLCWQDLYAGGQSFSPLSQLPTWLFTVTRHLQQHLETTVQELATLAGYSPAQFRRVIERYLHMSPQAFLHLTRLRQAQRLLTTTDMPVYTIAEQVGYTSVAYFSHLFVTHIGLTPHRYRRNSTASSL